ncbi:hypothetical protein Taro_031379 [Colocasia esculenta]|uniref:Uncharacterized protein n=1 Tax=Colocasia esculenta TaxID=4460 RepID=A0A843VYW2_COLES|nr:hypothetical protein [Colocasia esculenta]
MSLRLSFSLSLFLVTAAAAAASLAAAASGALPGCPNMCGNVSVPYPFGIAQGCYMPGFRMTCNDTYDPPRMFMNSGNLHVTEITDDHLTIDILIARDCYKPLNLGPDIRQMYVDVTGTPYTLSYERNRFTALGCDTIAINYRTSFLTDYTSGCVAFCGDTSSITNGSCSGIGCCQTAIPQGVKRLNTMLRSLMNHTTSFSISPCSFAFLVDQERYVFDVADLRGFASRSRVPAVLDWAIGSQACEEVKGAPDYACGPNSYCLNSTNGPGYRCRCNSGYQGNPYLPGGCQDIDECADASTNPCAEICTNTPGSYVCSCRSGKAGDGKKSGTGCIRQSKRFPLIQVVLGAGLGSVFLLAIASWSYWALKKRRMIVLREKFFKQNGGLLLQQQIASRDGAAETARIFTSRELEEATDNYSESRVLGRGGYGTVYKGILPDQKVVAIKKSKVVEEGQVEQFINEVVVLSQVIHRNVVKILGCCLETPVPLLVYEYVPNGTLTHHLHDGGHVSSLSWETRLRIAAETAGALAYLHSAAARPIIHRDVKTANILLDKAYTAKVADFGASRLVPLDRAQITTLVQGTLGYLDPEYFQTGQLTEKSDVYSFGVVLAELLTGQKPLSPTRPQQEKNLAIYFLLAMRGNRAFQILEPRVRNEGSREQLEGVMEVAKGCLRLKGEERPTMKEVAAELERLRRASAGAHPWAEGGGDDTAYHSLVDQRGNVNASAYYTSASSGDDSIEAHILLSLDMQR